MDLILLFGCINRIMSFAPGDTTTNYTDAGGATNGAGRFYRVRPWAVK